MGKLERLEAAIAAGMEMRVAQKEFFKTRDRNFLTQSKALERQFDHLSEAALKPDDLLERQ